MTLNRKTPVRIPWFTNGDFPLVPLFIMQNTSQEPENSKGKTLENSKATFNPTQIIETEILCTLMMFVNKVINQLPFYKLIEKIKLT